MFTKTLRYSSYFGSSFSNAINLALYLDAFLFLKKKIK